MAARRRGRILLVARDILSAAHLAEEIPFFAPETPVRLLPDWETLPYDALSPPANLVAERVAALVELLENAPGITIVAAATALFPFAPPSFLGGRAFSMAVGDSIDMDGLLARLAAAGFARVDRVRAPGEFALYGGQVDVFAPGAPRPFRLVLFDREIEEIRFFSPATQLSLGKTDRLKIIPAREFPLDADGARVFAQNFGARFDDVGYAKSLRQGAAPEGVEFLLPLFFADGAARIFDYAHPEALLVSQRDLAPRLARFLQDAKKRQEVVSRYEGRPALPVEELFLSAEDFFRRAREFESIEIDSEPHPRAACAPFAEPPAVDVNPRAAFPRRAFFDFARGFSGRVVVALDSEARRAAFLRGAKADGEMASASGAAAESESEAIDLVAADSFAQAMAFTQATDSAQATAPAATEAAKRVAVVLAPLRAGFVAQAAGGRAAAESESVAGDSLDDLVAAATTITSPLAIVTEAELYRLRLPPRAHRPDEGESFAHAGELSPGDFVLHREHGVGCYRGLSLRATGGVEDEFLEIEYDGGARLLTPVADMRLVSRYIGGESAPSLAVLGSPSWRKRRARAQEQARDAAAHLLEIYAHRANAGGCARRFSQSEYDAFAARFAFVETPDQASAIAEVVADLRAPRPMDRLVAADVGFGKTEVAIRAAFVVAKSGAQVALLAPTTLLAAQHFRVFAERFAGEGLTVGLLSRGQSAPEKAQTLRALAAGEVSIVVGTHSLLQKDTRFADLGLSIIDEEHRFGVRHKERFKKMRAEVDFLSLTATPIPRSLAMALEGARDLSVIGTPPPGRLAIKTFVLPHSDGAVREACEREMMRGGQIFFVHNEVSSLPRAVDDLRQIVPDARVAYAHGGMRAAELERVMGDFLRRDIDILAASSIIESGLDIANANTLVVSRAHRFGLAQLHQLRGRVGRSRHQAFAYFFAPEMDELGKPARARLAAVRDFSSLGAGFSLAMRDLEIRGAGEFLGEKQSGEIAAVGLEAYQSMLRRAMREIKSGDRAIGEIEDSGVTIELGGGALIPPRYCGSPAERMGLYRRLAECETDDAIDAVFAEMRDRFGEPPPPARLLASAHRLRRRAEIAGANQIVARAGAVFVRFVELPPTAAALAQKIAAGRCALAGADRIRIEAGPDAAACAAAAKAFLDELLAAETPAAPVLLTG